MDLIINDNIINPYIRIYINDLSGNLIIINLDSTLINLTWNDIKKYIRIKLEENNELNYIIGIKLIHNTLLNDDDNINIHNDIYIQLCKSSIMLKNDINQSINMLLDKLYENFILNNSQKDKLWLDLIELLNNIIIDNSIEAMNEFATILLNRACNNNKLQNDYMNLIISFKDKDNFKFKKNDIEYTFRYYIVNMLQNKFEIHLEYLKVTKDLNNIDNHKLLISIIILFSKIFANKFVSRIILAKVASELCDNQSYINKECIILCFSKIITISKKLLHQTDDGTLLYEELNNVLNKFKNKFKNKL